MIEILNLKRWVRSSGRTAIEVIMEEQQIWRTFSLPCPYFRELFHMVPLKMICW